MSHRLDLALVEKDLARDALEPAGQMKWLRQSYGDSAGFWHALIEAHNALFPWPGKSSPFRSYDFYHDIIARNLRNPAPALRWYGESYGWQELSYEQLGRQAARKAAQWARIGAGAGRKLCIVSYLNELFVVALLAALKTGLIVSFLPPWGPSFLKKRIDELSPDFIWTEEENFPLLAPYRHIILAEEAPAGGEEESSSSHCYAAGETFALCYDPTAPSPHVPRALTSDAAYLGAVRDGMIALGIKPGHAVAAPGLCVMEAQPALLLACLLAGATFVHLDEEDVARAPEHLVDRPLRAVGVTPAIREMLLQKPVEVGKTWDSWFRDPAASQEMESWKDLVDALGLHDAYSINQKWNASVGGCVLFSIRRKGTPHFCVLPAAGVPWRLADPADLERESLWNHGLFSVCPPGGEDSVIAGGILAGSRNEWMFVRPVQSGRLGRCYPAEEVLEALSAIPHGSSCTMAEVPSAGASSLSSFVLLVFVGGRKVDEPAIAQIIRKRVLSELGKEFVPDHIQIIHLHPRRGEDGSIDHGWCGSEYLSGGLSRRARGEVFRCITELRDLIHLS
jgi:hypothetical protein